MIVPRTRSDHQNKNGPITRFWGSHWPFQDTTITLTRLPRTALPSAARRQDSYSSRMLLSTAARLRTIIVYVRTTPSPRQPKGYSVLPANIFHIYYKNRANLKRFRDITMIKEGYVARESTAIASFVVLAILVFLQYADWT